MPCTPRSLDRRKKCGSSILLNARCALSRLLCKCMLGFVSQFQAAWLFVSLWFPNVSLMVSLCAGNRRESIVRSYGFLGVALREVQDSLCPLRNHGRASIGLFLSGKATISGWWLRSEMPELRAHECLPAHGPHVQALIAAYSKRARRTFSFQPTALLLGLRTTRPPIFRVARYE
jgi:hypothetical protein